MKRIATAFFMTLGLLSLGAAQNAHAFDVQFEDTGVPVYVEAEPPFCKSDVDCPYGQQCDTGAGSCFTPSSATACACAPDGDPCTDDAGIPSSYGGCYCPHNRLTTPECSTKEEGTPVSVHRPVNFPGTYVTLDPTTPDPAPETPKDPTTPDPTLPPTPPLPPAVTTPGVCEDPALSSDQRLCCIAVGGDPLLMMEKCVSDDRRSSDCDLVVNVMGDVGDKAQMNVCCNLLNNEGTIEDSSVNQECKNAFGTMETPPTATAPSGIGSSKISSPAGKSVSEDAGAPSGGCSLIRNAGGFDEL